MKIGERNPITEILETIKEHLATWTEKEILKSWKFEVAKGKEEGGSCIITYTIPYTTPYIRLIFVLSKECQCGSEKCGSSMHSDWCPKYQQN